MNGKANPHMVGYKLKKFAPFGVKKGHQIVEKRIFLGETGRDEHIPDIIEILLV